MHMWVIAISDGNVSLSVVAAYITGARSKLEYIVKRPVYIVNKLGTNMSNGYPHRYKMSLFFVIKRVEHVLVSLCALYKVISMEHSTYFISTMINIAYRRPCFEQHSRFNLLRQEVNRSEVCITSRPDGKRLSASGQPIVSWV